MNRSIAGFTVMLVALSTLAGSGQQSGATAEKLLASAQHKASIEGDLKGAIEEYNKAVAAAGTDRALAARALLQMAECYQKLGDAQAQAIYQRLVRDYADQQDTVVLARARLATPPSVARTRSDWSVWAGREADGFGTISPDGRFMTYTDWDNGASLALRDLTTGTNHRLTSGGGTEFSAISRDGKQVAYEWFDANTPPGPRQSELRIASLRATSISEPRRLFHNDDVTRAAPFDWSPDGKWIAVEIGRKDGTRQIALIGAHDGALHVLKSIDWKKPTKIFFSPDSRYIAYDLMVSDNRDERHVFVMPVDGSREADVVADPSQNVIMGWSPDGRYVLFSSNRSGTFGLWAVPVHDGKPEGAPTLLKGDVASSWSLGVTTAGTMYVWKYASPILVQASAIDLTSGELVSSPTNFKRFIGSRGRPDWSADGKYLAYQSCDPLGAGPCTLWIQSMETGQARELKVKLGYFFFPRWSPDGRELLVIGTDLRGRNNGLYRIDVQTGEATLVVAPRASSTPQWAPDGKHVYFARGSVLIERDLASGAEREVVKFPSAPGAVGVSPDGSLVAYDAAGSAGGEDLFVMSTAGGPPRVLLHVAAPEHLARFEWASEGAAIAVAKRRDDGAASELWLVPVGGERPHKLDLNIDNWSIEDGFRFDRAGRHVAFVATAGQPGLEIRALENFLPARATTAQPKKK
jgi:Tol biopolymer transport system component